MRFGRRPEISSRSTIIRGRRVASAVCESNRPEGRVVLRLVRDDKKKYRFERRWDPLH